MRPVENGAEKLGGLGVDRRYFFMSSSRSFPVSGAFFSPYDGTTFAIEKAEKAPEPRGGEKGIERTRRRQKAGGQKGAARAPNHRRR
jgi:hypothetical protein